MTSLNAVHTGSAQAAHTTLVTLGWTRPSGPEGS